VEKGRDDGAADLHNCFAQEGVEERIEGHRNGGGISNA